MSFSSVSLTFSTSLAETMRIPYKLKYIVQVGKARHGCQVTVPKSHDTRALCPNSGSVPLPK